MLCRDLQIKKCPLRLLSLYHLTQNHLHPLRQTYKENNNVGAFAMWLLTMYKHTNIKILTELSKNQAINGGLLEFFQKKPILKFTFAFKRISIKSRSFFRFLPESSFKVGSLLSVFIWSVFRQLRRLFIIYQNDFIIEFRHLTASLLLSATL